MGPDEKDVATGSFVGVGEAAQIGAQKATITELLIQSEEYSVSPRIVNGLSRNVAVLEVMRLGGDADSVEGRCRSRRRVQQTSNIATWKGRSLAERAMLLLLS
jgi:hypothetical protein